MPSRGVSSVPLWRAAWMQVCTILLEYQRHKTICTTKMAPRRIPLILPLPPFPSKHKFSKLWLPSGHPYLLILQTGIYPST